MLCAALLAAPLVALHGGPAATAATARPATFTSSTVLPDRTGPPHARSARGRAATHPGHGAPVVLAAAPVLQVVPTTIPTTTTTTTAPPATTTAPPATTTTTTLTAVPVGGAVETTGIVTYYDHPPGRCASPWLPFGTVVEITNPANGLTVTCMVDDREADTARSIDLATTTFAELAPLSQGVIDARLSW